METHFSLAPIAIARVCSSPWSSLDGLRAEETARITRERDRVKVELGESLQELLRSLHGLVPSQQNQDARAVLIRAQRSIHNGRPVARWLPEVQSVGDLSTTPSLERIAALDAQIAELDAHLGETYDRELAQCAARLQEVAAVSVASSLALAAPTIAADLTSPAGTSRRDARRRAKRDRVLYTYLARSASRTTPFADFAFVCAARFETQGRTAQPQVRRRVLRLNRELGARLARALVRSPGLRAQLRLRAEPTAFADDGVLWFSGLSPEGAHSMLRLNATPTALQIWDALRRDKSTPSTGRLLDLENHMESVAALLGVAFLSPEWDGLIDGPGWERHLLSALERLPEDPVAARAAELLRSTQRQLAVFAEQPAAQRVATGFALRQEWTRTLHELDAPVPRPHEPLLYEDAAGSGLALQHDRYRPALDALARWVGATVHLSWTRLENGTMRSLFDQYYGPDVTSVPLLTFFRDYFARYMCGAGQLPPRLDAVSIKDFPLRRQIEQQRSRLREYIAERCEAARHDGEVDLRLADLGFLSAPRDERGPESVAVFALPLESGRLVVNAGRCHLGFGKFLSRFLDLLPGSVLTELRERYAALGSAGFAEIRGGSSFTGNVRPQILSRAIAVPGSFATPAEETEQLDLEELHVCRSGADGVALQHCGNPIVPIDTSFLDPRQSPAIVRLLNGFGPASSFSACLPWQGLAEDSDGVRRRPRITFEGSVILGRKSWLVPASSLPTADPRGPEVNFIPALEQWRVRFGLPERLYAKLRSAENPDVISPLLDSARGVPVPLRDWSQSRMLDLCSPFSARQVAHLCDRLRECPAPLSLELEEPLPGPEDSLCIDGERRLCELLLHFERGIS